MSWSVLVQGKIGTSEGSPFSLALFLYFLGCGLSWGCSCNVPIRCRVRSRFGHQQSEEYQRCQSNRAKRQETGRITEGLHNKSGRKIAHSSSQTGRKSYQALRKIEATGSAH